MARRTAGTTGRLGSVSGAPAKRPSDLPGSGNDGFAPVRYSYGYLVT